MAQQSTWCLSYGRGLGVPNSICKDYFGRIVEDSQSLLLNDESLRTLMAEVELIINSRPLTVETISDSKSEIPLSPSNLVTMKTSVTMPPPGEFSKPDASLKRRWRRVQHIAEFWSRWRKEFLQSLQVRQIWKKRI